VAGTEIVEEEDESVPEEEERRFTMREERETTSSKEEGRRISSRRETTLSTLSRPGRLEIKTGTSGEESIPKTAVHDKVVSTEAPTMESAREERTEICE
jgi:hypothetical protein